MLLTERTEFHQFVGKAQPRGSPRTARARPGAHPAHLTAHRFRRPRRGGARPGERGAPLAGGSGRAPASQSDRDPAEPHGPGSGPAELPRRARCPGAGASQPLFPASARELGPPQGSLSMCQNQRTNEERPKESPKYNRKRSIGPKAAPVCRGSPPASYPAAAAPRGRREPRSPMAPPAEGTGLRGYCRRGRAGAAPPGDALPMSGRAPWRGDRENGQVLTGEGGGARASRSRSGAAPGWPGLRAVGRPQDNGREEGAGAGGRREAGRGRGRPPPLRPPASGVNPAPG